MLRRREQDIQSLLDAVAFPPIELNDFSEPLPPEESLVAQADDEQRIKSALQPLERGDIQMIVMIVAKEHDVDTRKVSESKHLSQSRWAG